MMPYFARVLKLDVLNAGDMVGPVRRENGNWSADNKIDVVCDFPIPMLKAKRIDVGMSTRGKKFSDPVEPQRGFGPSAQLLSLFLHSPKSDLDELVAESAQELANNLFRELHGRDVTFEKNVSTPKSPQLLAEMKGGDVVLSASKCLIEDDLKGGMFKASLAGSTEKLAENIAIAVNRRFDITSVNAAQILAY
jgi:hypothetical protein